MTAEQHAQPGTPRPDANATIALLSQLLDGVPPLPEAACRGYAELFDGAADGDPDDQAAALAICATCPDLERCRDWLESLPRNRIPRGVIAGQLHRPRGATRSANSSNKPRRCQQTSAAKQCLGESASHTGRGH